MKKLLTIAAVAMLALTACSKSEAKDLVITKTAQGMSEISVTLTFDASTKEIKSAELDCSGETPSYGQAACQYYTDNNSIVAAQGEVEVVSGSTVTCKAVNKAIKKAIEEANQ